MPISMSSPPDTLSSLDAANQALSNLDSPTDVNQHLVPGAGNTYDLGTTASGDRWRTLYTRGGTNLTDATGDEVLITSVTATLPSTSTAHGAIRNNIAAKNIGVYTNNVSSSGATGSVFIETGNQTASSGTSASGALSLTTGTTAAGATGNSGAITLASGNSSGGNSGSINLNTGTAGGTRGSVFMHSGAFEFTQDGSMAIENMLTINSKNRTAPSGDTSQENIVSEEQDSNNLFAIFTATNAGANATGTQALEIGTGKVNNASATGTSGELYIVTGPNIATDNTTLTGAASLGSGGHSGGGGTGGVSVRSGNVSGASSVGNTGDVNVSSGSVSSNNTSGYTGGVLVTSGSQFGDSADGDTGAVQVTSGGISHSASTGETGLVFITSGDHAGTGNTGDVMIYTGQHSGTGDTGKIQIYTGENAGASGTGGNIELWCGSGPSGYGFIDAQAASLKLTGSFCPAPATHTLLGDNETLSVNNTSYKAISSDNATASNRTFILSAGDRPGHIVVLEWVGTNAGELIDDSAAASGNHRLSATWTPTQYDTLTLIWNGTDWLEICRSTN